MLRWIPRVLAILMGFFLALFAFDATGGIDLLMHLAPVAIVALVSGVAWRHEWIGATAFALLALAYAVVARDHPLWVSVIAGPMLAIAVLYALSALRNAGTNDAMRP